MEYWLKFWWVFPIALVICVAVCTVSISGSVLFVPFFTLAFPALGIPLSPIQAVQVGLFTEIFGFASSTSAFWRSPLIDFNLARFSLLFAAPLAVTGGVLANLLPAGFVLAAIGGVMLMFGYLLYRSPTEEEIGGRAQEERADLPGHGRPVEHCDAQGRVYRYRRQNDRLRAGAMTVPAVLIGGRLAGWLAGRVSQDMLRRVLAVFLIILALVTGVRAAAGGELPVAGWVLAIAALVVFGLAGIFLWRGRELAAKFCYASGFYYCRTNGG